MTLQTVVAQGNENITLYEQLKDRLYIVGVKEGERFDAARVKALSGADSIRFRPAPGTAVGSNKHDH
jgi:hypothetical protein